MTQEEVKEYQFQERYLKLKTYYDEYKHLNIPNKHYLYKCLSNSRTSVKNKIYSIDQINKLEEIGFILDKQKYRFNEKFKIFKEYIENEKKVPTNATRYKEVNIGDWYFKQIVKYKNNNLELYQKDEFSEIQNLFPKLSIFITNIDKWNDKYNKLKKELRENKELDCHIQTWLYNQKQLFRQNLMDSKRFQLFQDIGIDMSLNTIEEYNSNLKQKIKEYKNNFGDLEIKHDYITNDGYKLGLAYNNLRARVKDERANKNFVTELKKEKLYIDFYSNKKRSAYNAMSKKPITNTSGYIGVYRASEFITKGGSIRPSHVMSKLKYNKITHTIGKYDDSKKGLLQGAIDRDIYIIEHNLPHRRNFTDEELLNNVYLSESEEFGKVLIKTKNDLINILKNKLNNQINR